MRPGALLIVDGRIIEAESLQMVRGEQVMVGLRDLEKLGWGVVSTGLPDEIIFKAKGVTLSFTKGQSVAMVNSLPVKLMADVYTHDGRLMVPLSFVAKALGYNYECVDRPVATIITNPVKPARKAGNSVRGVVIYNGLGVDRH